jgi:hypothetical protein
VQQLSVNDFYLLGKRIDGLEKELKTEAPIPLSRLMWHMFSVRNLLTTVLTEPCTLLMSSQRAARGVITRINNFIPEEFEEIVLVDQTRACQTWELSGVSSALTTFETVLSNDMPEMSTFAVGQIGILRTDDLIHRAYRQIAEPLQPLLQEKAKADIIEAGKCLAFRLSTACAFHACRAIEAGIDQYYEILAGKPYKISPNGGNNNWGAKTEALVQANADQKVTEFLTHIRKQYRNPVTHPEVVVDEHEAVDLFVAALSAISMMLGATKLIAEKNQPILPGLGDGLGEWYATVSSLEGAPPSIGENVLDGAGPDADV